MRWKQFFTPVKSINALEANQLLSDKSSEQLTTLDVRQPKEYHQHHIPGAKLIPLANLDDQIDEINKDIPVLVYCAIGGRSRAAAQLLAGRGYDVLNLSGGIKAWQGNIAVGDETAGLDLFSGNESIKEILVVAYSLEQGLEDFYISLAEKVSEQNVKDLFRQLSSIESLHRQSILEIYQKATGDTVDHEVFAARLIPGVLEGGLSTEEYLELFNPDLNSSADVISLAMSIESQALDLYERAAQRSESEPAQTALRKIASEEKQHLQHLGKLLDSILE